MSASLFVDHAIIEEAQERIRARREQEKQRFEWNLATHLLDGGAIVEWRGGKRHYWSLTVPHCAELGAIQCAALITEHYHESDTTLDFEAAP